MKNLVCSHRILTYSGLKHRRIVEERSALFDLCFWPYPHGRQEIVFEGYAKVQSGVRHLVNRYTKISAFSAFSGEHPCGSWVTGSFGLVNALLEELRLHRGG